MSALNEQLFVLDDSIPSRDYYNDLASAGDLSFTGILESIYDHDWTRGIAGAESAICDRVATDNTPRLAYVPMTVLLKDDDLLVIMEVAQTPSEMLVTGGCGCS